MRVGVVLIAVMVILIVWLLQCELFEPMLEVTVQSALVVVDEYTRSYIHSVDKTKPLSYSDLDKRDLTCGVMLI